MRAHGKSDLCHSRGKHFLETPNSCDARDRVDVPVHGCVFNYARTSSLRLRGPTALSDSLLPTVVLPDPIGPTKTTLFRFVCIFKIINYESSLYFAPQYGQLTLP